MSECGRMSRTRSLSMSFDGGMRRPCKGLFTLHDSAKILLSVSLRNRRHRIPRDGNLPVYSIVSAIDGTLGGNRLGGGGVL